MESGDKTRRVKDGNDEFFGIKRNLDGKFAIDFVGRRRIKKADGRTQIVSRAAGGTASIRLSA